MHIEVKNISNPNFRPLFIVGFPRSGTTMLANIMDRHSQIAIPPETRYLREVLPRYCWLRKRQFPVATMTARLLENRRIDDLRLDAGELEGFLRGRFGNEISFREAFEGLLQCYCEKRGKSIAGEKSPIHLLYVPLIMAWFPGARIICIVRDGRDAILSLMNTPWAKRDPHYHAREWNYRAYLADSYAKRFPNSFKLVRYEDILRDAGRVVRELCTFTGIPYEVCQCSASLGDGNAAGVVPEWELAWKGKALESVDPSRSEIWRTYGDQALIAKLSRVMAYWLSVYGYEAPGSRLNTGMVNLDSRAFFLLSVARRYIRETLKDFLHAFDIEEHISQAAVVEQLKQKTKAVPGNHDRD